MKEKWAVDKSLESVLAEIQDCRVDIQLANQAIIYTWHERGSHSKDLTRVSKRH